MSLKAKITSIFNKDFKLFNKEIPWILASPEIKLKRVRKIKSFTFTNEFQETFPNLYILLKNARRTDVELEWYTLSLYCWTIENNIIQGWVILTNRPERKNISREHELILNELGEIKTVFNIPDNSILTKFSEFFDRSSTLNSLIDKNRLTIKDLDKIDEDVNNLILINDFHTTRYLYFYSLKSNLIQQFEQLPNSKSSRRVFKTLNQGQLTFNEFVEKIAEQWNN